MSTTIPDVGMQVWAGSLLLGDFVIESASTFSHANIVELGGGTGLTSIVASRHRSTPVFCTDVGQEVLKNCQRNALENMCDVRVRELDWMRSDTWLQSGCDCSSTYCVAWHDHDLELLNSRPLVLLAADGMHK